MDANVRLKPFKPKARQVRAPWGDWYWVVRCNTFSATRETLGEALAEWQARAGHSPSR